MELHCICKRMRAHTTSQGLRRPTLALSTCAMASIHENGLHACLLACRLAYTLIGLLACRCPFLGSLFCQFLSRQSLLDSHADPEQALLVSRAWLTVCVTKSIYTNGAQLPLLPMDLHVFWAHKCDWSAGSSASCMAVTHPWVQSVRPAMIKLLMKMSTGAADFGIHARAIRISVYSIKHETSSCSRHG